MNTKLICGLFALILTLGSVRADEPNADAAKAIQEIAARRAEKESLKAKQSAEWSGAQGRERATSSGGFAPGQTLNPLGARK